MINFFQKHKAQLLSSAVSAALVMMPFLALAWSPTSGEGIVPTCDAVTGCGWDDLIKLMQNIIDFLVYATVFVAAIAFAVAGFKYLTAGGNVGQVKSAHAIFKNVAIGLIFVLSAFLIVKTILVALLKDTTSFSLLS